MKPPRIVVVALPLAYQDGMDKYSGIMRYLQERDLGWELRIVRNTVNVELFEEYATQEVSGAICGTSAYFDGDRNDDAAQARCLGICRRRNIPLVALDWTLKAARKISGRCTFLNIDSRKIGEIAAQTVLKAGNYASYGFIGINPGCAWSNDRGASFVRSLHDAGRCDVRSFKWSPLDGSDEMSEWLSALPKPAAVFAANDCVADAVLKACQRSGVRVPEDISVLGVDDDPVFCVHTRPTLSSIHPDFADMGYQAASTLDRMMAGIGGGERIVIAGSPTVTNRMSTAPCSSVGMLVRRIDEIIASRACQNIDSNIIAAELKISRRLLDLRYRQLTGNSVKEAIVNARIKRAKHLLAYSRHSIGTISSLCGYKSESHLGKVFKECEGVSMGGYRSGLMEKSRQ